jgi:hypothetical protein
MSATAQQFIAATSSSELFKRTVLANAKPCSVENVEMEKVGAGIAKIGAVLEELGVKEPRNCFGLESVAATDIATRVKELTDEKQKLERMQKILETYPKIQLLDVASLLKIQNREGLPACVPFELNDQETSIRFRFPWNAFHGEQYEKVTVPGLSPDEARYATIKVNLTRHNQFGGGENKQSDLQYVLGTSLLQFHKELRAMLLGPKPKATAVIQPPAQTPGKIQNLGRALLSSLRPKPPKITAGEQELLRKVELHQKADQNLQEIELTHSFGKRLIPKPARECIEKALDSRLFESVYLIAEATDWKMSCSFYNEFCFSGWKPACPCEIKIGSDQSNRDPLIVGFADGKHYLLGAFDVTPLEEWLSLEFASSFQK